MSDNQDMTQIVATISSILLFISEALPFLKRFTANGIIHLIYNSIKQHITSNEQQEPLLDTVDTEVTQQYVHQLNSTITKCTANILDNSGKLTLQPSELYELNYIINYIKVNFPKKSYKTSFLSMSNKMLLISQGYIVDYDCESDIHVIKW